MFVADIYGGSDVLSDDGLPAYYIEASSMIDDIGEIIFKKALSTKEGEDTSPVRVSRATPFDRIL